MTVKAGRTHDEVVVEMLRADPEFADAYLAAALEETEQPGGHQAMLTALRHMAEAQSMARRPTSAASRQRAKLEAP